MHPAPHIREGDGDRGARLRGDGATCDQEFGGDVRHRVAVGEARRDQAADAAAQRGAVEAVVPASGLQRRGGVFVGPDPQHRGPAGAGRPGKSAGWNSGKFVSASDRTWKPAPDRHHARAAMGAETTVSSGSTWPARRPAASCQTAWQCSQGAPSRWPKVTFARSSPAPPAGVWGALYQAAWAASGACAGRT